MSESNPLLNFAVRIEKLAFEMPAPNPYTPQFVMLAQSLENYARTPDTSANMYTKTPVSIPIAETCIETSAVELVRELVDELKCYRDCVDCNGTGEVFDEASNLMGHHGWLTCWKCYDSSVMQKITKAEQWLKTQGE